MNGARERQRNEEETTKMTRVNEAAEKARSGGRMRQKTQGNETDLALDLGLAAVVELDGDAVGVGKAGGALDVVDLVLLEEELDALRESADGVVLGLEHDGEVELDVGHVDAALGEFVLGLVVLVRVVEHGL
jgi:hypothetical protein